MSDIITMMETLFKLWTKQVFQKSFPIEAVYKNCDAYLSEFLGKNKKDITGSQFAQLVDLIAQAHTSGLHSFDERVIHRL
jgi:hypothetical protein